MVALLSVGVSPALPLYVYLRGSPSERPAALLCRKNMRYLLRRHLFLSIGVFTLGLFFAVALLDRAHQTGISQALGGVMRVLIVPMYLVWLLLTMAEVAIFGPHAPSAVAKLITVVAVPAGLAPYVLADYLMHGLRRRRARN